MLYLVAIFVPPLALLLHGQLGRSILNVVFCVVAAGAALVTIPLGGIGGVLWLVPIFHAWSCIWRRESDLRDARLLKAMATGQGALGKRK